MLETREFSKLIKFFVFLDSIVFIVSIIPKEKNLLSYSLIIFNIVTVCFVWYLKSKYHSWDEVVNYPLYFLLLFIFPPLITTLLTYLGMDKTVLINYRVERILLFVSKLILYQRLYKLLKSNPELDQNVFESQ